MHICIYVFFNADLPATAASQSVAGVVQIAGGDTDGAVGEGDAALEEARKRAVFSNLTALPVAPPPTEDSVSGAGVATPDVTSGWSP